MDFAQLHQLLIGRCGLPSVLEAHPEALQPWVQLAPEALVAAVSFLQATEGLYFDHLACLTGMDYGPDKTEDRFGVVYHLSSLPYGHRLVLKVSARTQIRAHPPGGEPRSWPCVPSLTSLHGAADWHEREAYDLLGIYFEGHPDLRRMLLPEDWEGHPLRKDYRPAEFYHGIAIASPPPQSPYRS